MGTVFLFLISGMLAAATGPENKVKLPSSRADLANGCVTCHSMKGEGGISGPDLTGIGARRSAGYLRESLVDPSAAVPDGYLLVSVVTKGGEKVSGVRVNEDSFSLQIRDGSGR